MSVEVEELCQEPVNGEKCILLKDHLVPCSSQPDGWLTIPNVPWNEIVRGLWMGGSHYYDARRLDFFDAVLTLTSQAPSTRWPTEELRFRCSDGRDLPEPEGLANAVDWVFQRWAAEGGRRVLIRCQAGLNRSGLLTALVMYKRGYPVDQAIELIRERRSPYALCNPRFVEHLRSLP